MYNPWIHLPSEPPYILDIDKAAIEHYNLILDENHVHRVHTELLPEPYHGKPDSSIVILTGNPGFHRDDIIYHQNNDYFNKCSRENLIHSTSKYPIYLLDPKISDAPGCKYWKQRLGYLLNEFNVKYISNKLFIVEIHGYHSKKFKVFSKKNPLRSKEYSFHLIQQSLKNNALIVIMRNKRNWLTAIPQLRNYRYLYNVRSVRNPTISPKNCEGYKNIRDRLLT